MTDEPAVVVCVYDHMRTPHNDNVRGVCSMCGAGIQWRPHAPNVPKVCIRCCADILEEDLNPRIAMTETTAREVQEYFKKGSH